MKESNKKKFTIAVLSVGIAVSLGFSIYTSISMRNGDIKTTTHDVKTYEKATVHVQNVKEKEKKKEDVVLNPMDGKDASNISQGKEEMSLAEIHNTEQTVRNLFRQFKFEEGTDILNQTMNKYRLTGDAEVLQKLYYDGSLMMNLVPEYEEDDSVQTGEDDSVQTGEGIANDEGIVNVVKGLRDPEDVLLATLFLDPETREKVIVYEGSLNPIYQKGEEIQVIEKTIEPKLFYEIKIQYPETKVLHNIHFMLEGNSLNAYVMEDGDGNLSLYSIVDPNKKSHYYTISQWKKIRENMKNGLPALDGVILDDEKSSVTTPSEQDTPTDASNTKETSESTK